MSPQRNIKRIIVVAGTEGEGVDLLILWRLWFHCCENYVEKKEVIEVCVPKERLKGLWYFARCVLKSPS